MIAYIRGKLEEVTETTVIIESNGVGYEIVCANPHQFQTDDAELIKVHTYHHVREDAQILYGFKKTEEKVLFKQILNVSGIGPKGALSIVGQGKINEFVLAVEDEDEKYLTQFPGVGKKTARQMILDLKGKLPFNIDPVVKFTNDKDNGLTANRLGPEVSEAIEALKVLGYSDRELKAITPKLKQEEGQSTDDLIRKALALLAN